MASRTYSEAQPQIQAMTADEIIGALSLRPHPEGGFYRETFRDQAPAAPGTDRAASTAIYFLLPANVISRWHAVDAAEAWHFYAGAPLRLSIADPQGRNLKHMTLGTDFSAGALPQAVVPSGHWQQARSLTSEPTGWSLVGCTVAPGFTFEGFRLAAPDFNPEQS